ncbi:hypothetical protein H6P81_011592 [Aristolochia fimbriata]|uniref:DEP domain-containing protein n=1 Tax=Aristolochia fimbriata TaxID=158543 RepID=A0AAV7ERY9_ARIFI|nr:hypothetical protein H6P81_011592 [Aristolochia fimbriata]
MQAEASTTEHLKTVAVTSDPVRQDFMRNDEELQDLRSVKQQDEKTIVSEVAEVVSGNTPNPMQKDGELQSRIKPLDMDLGSAGQHQDNHLGSAKQQDENTIVSEVTDVVSGNTLDFTQKDGELSSGIKLDDVDLRSVGQHEGNHLGSAKQQHENTIFSEVTDVVSGNTLDFTQKDGELSCGIKLVDMDLRGAGKHEDNHLGSAKQQDENPIVSEGSGNTLDFTQKDVEVPSGIKPLDMDLGSSDQHDENTVSAVKEAATANTLGLTQNDGELARGMNSLSISKDPMEHHMDTKITKTEEISPKPIMQNVNDGDLLVESKSPTGNEIPNEQDEKAASSMTSETFPDTNSQDLMRQNAELPDRVKSNKATEKNSYHEDEKEVCDTDRLISDAKVERNHVVVGFDEEKVIDPVFDGTEDPEIKTAESSSSLDAEQSYAWPGKAVAFTNFVKLKGAVAVSSVFRRLSGKSEEGEDLSEGLERGDDSTSYFSDESGSKDASQQTAERSWNLLTFIKLTKAEQKDASNEQDSAEEPTRKGRVILYTRLGCPDCRVIRLFFQWRQIKYTEINVDIYPSRKLELEKNTGSSAVPKLYLNDFLVGGLSELKTMDESGKLADKLKDLINEEPPAGAPLPPYSGEDDVSGSGVADESAVIVRKMREHLVVKDRFYKMRRFTNCFLGSEAVDFLSDDQYLERDEAIELARKLGQQLFFQHVLDENVFEDGNHVYRFLDDDPVVVTQCYNIPRGILDIKPKPATEIASRLRFLMFAMFEAYVSKDGRHVDYRTIHGTEEYERYLRIVEELQRVNLKGLSREEKLAFFINLYNMMAIHAILTLGFPMGPLQRRKMFGEFKYVVGGSTYSLSAIQNGILRGNQRPPYALVKPFGPKDRQAKVAFSYTEPLVHFALVSGNRSGPALRCYSPANIDMELTEAAQDFLRKGGVVVDLEAKLVNASQILRWYSADFGKNEIEVLKHAANYLEPPKSERFLELLANAQLKVVYQPYDWSLNN